MLITARPRETVVNTLVSGGFTVPSMFSAQPYLLRPMAILKLSLLLLIPRSVISYRVRVIACSSADELLLPSSARQPVTIVASAGVHSDSARSCLGMHISLPIV